MQEQEDHLPGHDTRVRRGRWPHHGESWQVTRQSNMRAVYLRNWLSSPFSKEKKRKNLAVLILYLHQT